MLDELLLLSGNDIPFAEAQLTIHQPRIKEIAYISESRFWTGCQLLRFDKDYLIDQDKNGLSNLSNFNILMSIVNQKNLESQQARVNILSVLALLFPTKQIQLDNQRVQLIDIQDHSISFLNEECFENFQNILIDMFCLSNNANKQYNPSGSLAKKIADQMKAGQEKRAKLAPEMKMSLFSRYISILTVGEHKDMNTLMNYTVYQLMDEFNRFMLKLHFDSWTQYKIAGAEGLEDPEDWLKDIHNEVNNKDYDL